MLLSFNPARRRVLGTIAAAAIVLAFPLTAASGALAATPTTAQLMAPGPLPDMWIGKANAPVTIIEYASMTCPHCGAFHKETYPELKSKYIDTGKVRFVLREFPLDQFAAAAFMLARCIGPDKRNAMVDLLFDQQKNWAFADKPLEGLRNVVKQTGMTKKAFDACLKDQKLYNQVMQMRDIASKKFGVNATPTFFINGKKIEGEMSPAELDKAIAPFLKS
ncbi:MAG TPA: DsbA family protein [Beijerinckiaceae bacterium]|nr:DsbA family protein [Beijerinckiaceae bacterium]